MGPDDAGAQIVAHQDFDSDVVGMGMQIEVVLDREIDGLFHHSVSAALPERWNSPMPR